MSKHTPGPWRAEMNGLRRMAVVDKNYTYLTYKAGTDRMPDSELEANANLIAAAPCLLDALEGMVSLFPDGVDGEGPGIGFTTNLKEKYRAAIKAIARAKGVQT